jgi:hypothetical protein
MIAAVTARAFELPAQERSAILVVYAAARRVAARHFEGADAEAAAFYWTGFHATKTLNLPGALVRSALALGLSPATFLDRMTAYHALNDRESNRCAAAYEAFLACYRRMGGDPC